MSSWIIIEKTPYHKYAFGFDFSQKTLEYCRYLKATLGWKEFSFSEKKWRFKDPAIVYMLRDRFPDIVIDKEVLADIGIQEEEKRVIVEQERKAREIKETRVPLLQDIEGLKGNLYPYQKLGVEFFINSGGRALLADAMGIGKTAQALAYVVHQKIDRTLVICPASVKFAWANEVAKWTHLKSFVIDPGIRFEDIPYDTQVLVINYDLLRKLFDKISAVKWRCIIIDEAHYVKSPRAIRSKAVKQLTRGVEKVLLLTGTPILSRPAELFNLLNIIDRKAWNNWYQYAVRYCEGVQTYWGFEAKGASNIEELKSKIDRYFLRRTKDEVLKELPPKSFIETPVEMSSEYQDAYNTASENLVQYLKEHKKITSAEAMKVVRAEKLVRINYLRQIAALSKVESAREMIESITDSGEKVVVFSSFNAPIEQLKEKFCNSAVMITGKTPVEEREKSVKSFQEDPSINVFLGGIKSAGVGITLTAASNVIFIDYSWNPADHSQAQDRCHRIGQKAESINIYSLTALHTIDGFMKGLLNRKQKVFDSLIEDETVALSSDIIEEAIDEVKRQVKERKVTSKGISHE